MGTIKTRVSMGRGIVSKTFTISTEILNSLEAEAITAAFELGNEKSMQSVRTVVEFVRQMAAHEGFNLMIPLKEGNLFRDREEPDETPLP